MELNYDSYVFDMYMRMYIQHKHSNTALVSPGKSICTFVFAPVCLQGNEPNTLEISDTSFQANVWM